MSEKNKSGLGCLVIFGGIFLIAGLGAFIWQSIPIWKSWQADDWLSVSAKVISVEQIISSGDDSTTYSVKGQFSYEVNGQRYTSNQLNFYSGTDNVGDYQKSFYRKLSSIKNSQRVVTAYYNPSEPSEAVIDKEIRWEMVGFSSIFLLAFGGIGGGVIFAGFWGNRKVQQEDILKEQFYDQPWRWKSEWQGEHFSPNTKGGFIGVGIFAFFWNIISMPTAFFALPEIIKEQNYIGLVVLLFPLVGIGMIYWAVLLYLRHKKYGSTKLYLDDNRIKIGGLNKGSLVFAQANFDSPSAVIRLANIHKYESGSGDDRSTKEDVLWEDTQRVELYSTECPFEFKVPIDLQETKDVNSDQEYLWRLSIESKQKGPDLKLDYEVPAFKLSAEEQADIEAQETDLFYEEPINAFNNSGNRGDWTQIGVVQSYSNSGTEYSFPRMNKGLGLGLFVIGSIFVAVGIGVYIDGAPVLFPIVFGFLGGVAAIFGLRISLFKSRINIDGSNLHYQTGHIAFGKTRSIPKGSIKNFELTSNLSSGNTKYYNIQVNSHDGQKHTIAKNLKVKGDVNAFITKIKEELSLRMG